MKHSWIFENVIENVYYFKILVHEVIQTDHHILLGKLSLFLTKH
jgi:hypothetical protein